MLATFPDVIDIGLLVVSTTSYVSASNRDMATAVLVG
jgi:hypothetical protein